MPAPRYPLERTGGLDGMDRALSDVSLDVDRLEALAAAAPYTPAVPADWSGSSPATVQAALDRLAAALGPIP